jgi:hypothetical protein
MVGMLKGFMRQSRVKFGGVVGKLALIAVPAFLAMGAAAWRGAGTGYGLAAIGIIALTFLLAAFGILLFAQRNPAVALLEGSEWSNFEQSKAKYQSQISGPVSSDPLLPAARPQASLVPKREADLDAEEVDL